MSMDPHIAAQRAALRYVNVHGGAIRRTRRGRNFEYISPRGRIISDRKILARLKNLVIPPAWVQVWICPDPKGHIQATGFDARGRKQYLYHKDWTLHRNRTKFEELLAFAEVLPKI